MGNLQGAWFPLVSFGFHHQNGGFNPQAACPLTEAQELTERQARYWADLFRRQMYQASAAWAVGGSGRLLVCLSARVSRVSRVSRAVSLCRSVVLSLCGSVALPRCRSASLSLSVSLFLSLSVSLALFFLSFVLSFSFFISFFLSCCPTSFWGQWFVRFLCGWPLSGKPFGAVATLPLSSFQTRSGAVGFGFRGGRKHLDPAGYWKLDIGVPHLLVGNFKGKPKENQSPLCVHHFEDTPISQGMA